MISEVDITSIFIFFFASNIIDVDKTIKDMIHNEKSENEINEYVFKNTPSINSSCSNLLIEGITSCDELIRSNNIKEDAFV